MIFIIDFYEKKCDISKKSCFIKLTCKSLGIYSRYKFQNFFYSSLPLSGPATFGRSGQSSGNSVHVSAVELQINPKNWHHLNNKNYYVKCGQKIMYTFAIWPTIKVLKVGTPFNFFSWYILYGLALKAQVTGSHLNRSWINFLPF